MQKAGPLRNASLEWRDDLRSFFHLRRPPLGFVFGYGSEAHGAGARGVMLTAWRHEMGRGWSPEGAEDVNSTAGV